MRASLGDHPLLVMYNRVSKARIIKQVYKAFSEATKTTKPRLLWRKKEDQSSWISLSFRWDFGLHSICWRSVPSWDVIWVAPVFSLPYPVDMSSLCYQAVLPSSRSEFLSKSQVSNLFGAKPLVQCSNAGSSKRLSCSAVTTTIAPAERIKQGFEKFKSETYTKNTELFDELSKGQKPPFMVIACSDSRVCPTTILGFQPGEAFVVRNVANMVPPPEGAGYPGTSAALEFAVTALKVQNILVIGHSKCGGIKALMTQKQNAEKWSAFIQDWIEIGLPARASTLEAEGGKEIDQQCTKCEKEAVNVSLGNLLAFPFIKEAVTDGKVALHGGYYNFVEGSFEYWPFGVDGKPGQVSKYS